MSRADAEQMIISARLAIGWITEEDLAPAVVEGEEADAGLEE